MDKFPPEIWHRIFIQLDLLERIECTLVCQSWWRILDKYSLLYNVELKYEDQFNKFMDMIKQLPHRAAQVEELRSLTCFDYNFDKRTLLNTFPNARVLKVEYDQEPPIESDRFQYFYEPLEITNLKPKLRVLYDSVYCELAIQILESNLGGRLEELQLYFEETETISISEVMQQLKNLTVLTTLTIHNLDMNIEDLENIHASLPTLQVFTLTRIFLADNDMPPIAMPAPATSITTFNIRIEWAPNVDTHIQLYQYMLKKYINAEVVNYLDEAILEYDSDDASLVYLNGILDFYKLVKPNKSCTIRGVPDDVDVFEVFDGVGCQFEELCAYQCASGTVRYLAESKQAKCIQKLSLHNTAISTPHSLKSMVALTTLDLNLSNSAVFPIINLTDYLNACPPTLETLSIHCTDLEIDLPVTRLSSIKKLNIRCQELTRDLGDMISASFPKLTQLELCALMLCENVNITIQNQLLKSASFSFGQACIYGFCFKSPSQADPQLYYCFKDTKKCVLYNRIRNLPTITITSFTEKRLDLTRDIKIFSV